jgi:hypothetical protein
VRSYELEREAKLELATRFEAAKAKRAQKEAR